MTMRTLIVGDSIIKYLGDLIITKLSLCDVELKSFPGIKIEGLEKKLSSFDIGSFDYILVHVGTNNSSELLSSIVSKFNRLFDTIRNLNPKIKLLISGLVPRGPNRFSYGFVSAAYGTFLSSLNIKIEAINAELEQLADLQGFYFFRRNPTNWKGCLGRDGLHLNFKGNRELADDFVKQLEGRISTEHVYRRKSKSIVSTL